jgi:hypothetical protein
MRYYLCTDTAPVRLPQRLSRDLSQRLIALPQFANSIQRMVEVLVESKAGQIEKIELRPTHSRFDENGKVDLGYAAEAMAIILGGSDPRFWGKADAAYCSADVRYSPKAAICCLIRDLPRHINMIRGHSRSMAFIHRLICIFDVSGE